MASINGLQNNALVVNTIDGLTTIYATAIYDNGTLLTPGNYVPYTNASTTVDLAGQDLKNVANFSTLSAYAVRATIGNISTTALSTNTLSTATMVITNTPADTPNTYIALNTLGKVISYTPTTSFPIPSTLSTVTILASTATVSSIYASSLITASTFGGTTKLSTLTTNTAFVSSLTFSTFTQVANAPLSINGTLTSGASITAPTFIGNLNGTATNAVNLQLDAPTTQTIYLAGGFAQGSGTNQRIYNSILNYDVGVGILSTPQIRLSATPSDTIVSNKYLGLNTAGSTVLGTAGGGGTNIYSTLFTSTLVVYSTATISSLSASTIAVASSLTCSSLNTLPFGTGLFATNTSVAIAPNALGATTTGVDNIAIGFNSLKSVTTGGNNTAVGWTTGFGLVDGVNNVMIGTSAGGNIAKLDNGVYIGSNAIGSATLASNEIAIGYNTQGKGNNTVILGNTSHTKLYIPPVIQTISGTNMVFSTSVNSTISTVINGTTITTISTNGITLVNPASTLRTTGNKMALIATSSVNVESRLVVDSGVYTDSVRALPGGGSLLLGVLGSTNSYLYCYDTGYVQANGYFQAVGGAFTSYNTALTISSANTGIIMKSQGITFATIDNAGLTLNNLANYLTTDATISTLLLNGTSTIQMQTSYVSKVEVNPQGLSMITRTGGAGITSATYNATTLILTVNYTFAPFGGVAGAWVTITGLSPSALNGTYILITFTGTQATMQNYYGSATAITVSSAFLQVLTTATQGVVFGDSTYKATNSAPLVTKIVSNSAVANTPLAVAGAYTTPIGSKYLRVRMVGGGGGGMCYNSSPAAGKGGYTQFGSFYAIGGNIALGTSNPFWANSNYPYVATFEGGVGGGAWQISGTSTTATTATVQINSNLSNLFPVAPTVGSTFTINNHQPTSWNGTWTVASSTTTTITFNAVLAASTSYGIFVLNSSDPATFISPGGMGNHGNITTPYGMSGGVGGVSMLGGSAPGWGQINPSGPLAAQPAFTLGANLFGGGGRGGAAVGNVNGASGGGAGQYVETFISNPTTSYAFVIGVGGQGSGGDAGARYNSSPGAQGVIIVEAYF